MSTINLGPIDRSLVQAPVKSQYSLAEMAERATGLLLLTVTTPVIAGAALVVAALSRKSPFVAHRRVGQNKRPFWMLKLRTMWTPGDAVAPHGWIERVEAEPASDDKPLYDPRVSSRFAAFCRRHSIDELPQFWHVVRGEMSLVGPRPLTQSEIDRHYGTRAAELLSMKPGLTGLWQVYGRSAIRFPERAAMDLQLVRTLTPRMYLTIVVRTVAALVSGQGAW